MSADAISVVICTYNRADKLREALETAAQQETSGGLDYEVVVIDDGSTDHTKEVVESLAAEMKAPVRYVYQGGRGGIAPARNRGVEEAAHPWIVFFDDDQLADPHWLEHLAEVARAHGADCIGGPRCLDIAPEALAKLGPVCRGILGENLYEGPPEILTGKELPTTGNLLISKKIFDTVGIFDANAKSSGEDADLLGRARRAGFDIWTAPKAMVAHMIPEYRLTEPYFRWVSLRWGNQFARMDHNRGGLPRVLAQCAGRVAQALLLNAPKLALALARGDAAGAIDRKILLWRAWGYVRTSLHLLSPALFPQKQFLEQLHFRNERALFGKENGIAGNA